MQDPILHSVTKVKATPDSEVFILTVDLTDMEGERYIADYCSRPDDSFGLAPVIRQWLEDNTEIPIEPFVPPSLEETRVTMPPLTARQLRLGLLQNGKPPSMVTATIEALPDANERESAMIEWEFASTFNRTHPLIISVGAALGFTPEQIDSMWAIALTI